MFIAVEGPNGVGKSTVVAALKEGLERIVADPPGVVATKEPSASPLGLAARAMEGELAGLALAMACAADRLHHVEHEILPALRRGAWVITDRYVPSSLVLQRLDGMALDDIWKLNATVRAPQLTIYIEDDPATVAHRLASRDRLSRLEQEAIDGREFELYRDAKAFLDARGWVQHSVDARGRTPTSVADEIITVGTRR